MRRCRRGPHRCRARSLREYHFRSMREDLQGRGAGAGVAGSQALPPLPAPTAQRASSGLSAAQALPPGGPRSEGEAGLRGRAHLQVPELACSRTAHAASLCAAQVPEEAEGRPLRTAWALVLQQLPRETPGQPPPPDTQHHQPQGAREPHASPARGPARYPGSGPGGAGTPGLLHQTRPGPEPDKAPAKGMDPHLERRGYPKTTVPTMAFFLYR